GTQIPDITALSPASRFPRILNPANGMIIAVDPDIPPSHQRVPFTARNAARDLRFRLNGEILGPAAGQMLWQPRPGVHQLELIGPGGRIEDKVSFTVR